MHAIGRLNNTGVAGLTALIEAPVVELGDHLAGHDVLIQTALVAVGIAGILLGQLTEAFRRLVTGVELGKDLVGLCAGLFHRSLVGGVADGDQDVAHVREQIVVRAAGDVVQNVVNAAVVRDIGRVAFRAGCVEQPVGNVAAQRGIQLVFLQRIALVSITFLRGILRVFIGCVDEGLLVVCGVGGHRGGHLLLERGQLFLRQLLGGVAAVRCAFVAAVRRGLEQRVGDEELPVGHGVIAVGVRFILGGNLRVGIGEAVVDGLRIAACKRCNFKIFAEALLAAARAVDGRDIAVAVHVGIGGVEIERRELRLDGSLLLLGKRVAVGFGLVGDRVDLRCGGQTLLGEEIGPGLTGVGVIGLLVERRVGVQDIAHKIAVLLLHGAVGVFIEVVDHSRGKVVAADGRGGGVRGKEAAGQHIEEDNDTDDQNGADGDQRRLQALAHAFLCFIGSLRNCCLFLALVFFTGCAHLGSFLS